MSTKTKAAPKKAVKKDPMTKKSALVLQKPTKESYDGAKTNASGIEACCSERTPAGYDQDAELMIAASYEIKSLREQNRHMSTRLEMFDKMYTLFTADGGRRDGCVNSSNDIARNLEYRAEHRKAQAAIAQSNPQA